MPDASAAISDPERPAAQLGMGKPQPTTSPILIAIQQRPNSPFGALFLGVPPLQGEHIGARGDEQR